MKNKIKNLKNKIITSIISNKYFLIDPALDELENMMSSGDFLNFCENLPKFKKEYKPRCGGGFTI